MKFVTSFVAAAILTITSTSFAATKCTQRFTSNGNSLLKNTVAPSSSVVKTQTASVASTKAAR